MKTINRLMIPVYLWAIATVGGALYSAHAQVGSGVGTSSPPTPSDPSFDSLVVTGTVDLQGDIFNSTAARININEDIILDDPSPRLEYRENDAAADEGRWDWQANGNAFNWRTLNDAGTSADFMVATRSGNTVSDLSITATNTTLSGTLDVRGAISNGASTTVQFNDNIRIESANPVLSSYETDGALDEKLWYWDTVNGQHRLRAADDTFSSANSALTISRTGTTVDTLNVLATNLQHNGTAIEEHGTFNPTATGCTTSPTPTFEYSRTGNVVVLQFPNTTCTSNSTSLSYSGAPTSIRPTLGSGVSAMYACRDNGSNEYGTCAVNVTAAGVIQVWRNGSLTGWTASGVKGSPLANNVTYLLD